MVRTVTMPNNFPRKKTLVRSHCCGMNMPHMECNAPVGTTTVKIETQTKPYIDGVTGVANPTFDHPFNSFRISKPGCCELTVVTDCGSFPIPEWVTEFSSCDYYTDMVFNSIELVGSPDCIESSTIYVSGTISEEIEVEIPPTEPCVPTPINMPCHHGYNPCDC